MRSALALAAFCLAAGCLSAPSPAPLRAEVADVQGSPATRFPPDTRPVAASVVWREEVDGAAVDIANVQGDDPWEPRDAAVTYHGVHETYDEFGRRIPTFVFRYPAMVFVPDEGPIDGVSLRGHWEPHDHEMAFDTADGRIVSVADIPYGAEGWAQPGVRHPFSHLAAFAMAWKVFEGTGHREMLVGRITEYGLYYNFTPAPDDHPLPGECDPWRLTWHWDPPLPGALVQAPDVSLGEERRTLICVEEGQDFPLWAFDGTDGGSYRLKRQTVSFELPEFHGEALPPVEHPKAPWQEITGTLPLPGPTLMPPASDGGTWAQEVAERAAALYLSPAYLAYRAQSATPFPFVVSLNTYTLGLLTIPLVNVTLPPPALRLQPNFFWLNDGETTHFHWVYTQHGGPERGDVHIADPNGYDVPSPFEPMSAQTLPPLVPDGLAQQQAAPLLPPAADGLDLVVFPFDLEGDGVEPSEVFTSWVPRQACTERAEGWAAAVDAVDGHVSFAMRTLPGAGCPEEQPPLLPRPRLPSTPSLVAGAFGVSPTPP